MIHKRSPKLVALLLLIVSAVLLTMLFALKNTSNDYVVDRATLVSLQIPEIMSSARISPSFDQSGAIAGYRFDEIQQASISENAGLKVGDVLVSVNGVSISGPEDVLNIYKSFRSVLEFKLRIVRDGKPIENLVHAW